MTDDQTSWELRFPWLFRSQLRSLWASLVADILKVKISYYDYLIAFALVSRSGSQDRGQ